jgi:hypothetical protein
MIILHSPSSMKTHFANFASFFIAMSRNVEWLSPSDPIFGMLSYCEISDCTTIACLENP